jgi:hypothetical protein
VSEEITRYRKKPVVVEARRVQTGNLAEMAAWCGGVVYDETLEWDYCSGAVILPDGRRAHVPCRDWGVIVPTIEGVKGEFYPCKPDIFEATYEPAEADL